MDKFVEIDGPELKSLLDALKGGKGFPVHTLRVFVGDDCAKFKVNSGMWSPPMGKVVEAQ